jgi:uncharacterized protein (TIGR02996 family)
MPVDPTLLHAVINAPFDDSLRLRYATACEPEDPLRAQFIRLQTQPDLPLAANLPTPTISEQVTNEQTRRSRIARSDELLTQYGRTWAGPLAEWTEGFEYERGFVARVTMSTAAFLAHGEELMASAPIRLVRLVDASGHMRKLCESPTLAKVAALHLGSIGLNTDDLVPLVQSPHVRRLWWLELEWNKIDADGVELLAAAANLPALVYVGLESNPCNPMETIGVDGMSISDVQPTTAGAALEENYGTIPWLHYLSDSLWEYPPDPLGPPPSEL